MVGVLSKERRLAIRPNTALTFLYKSASSGVMGELEYPLSDNAHEKSWSLLLPVRVRSSVDADVFPVGVMAARRPLETVRSGFES